MTSSAQARLRITDAIGDFPYRLQLAGGWIDQPFVSRLNPTPPGSMVVVSLRPIFHLMDRAGMATGSRKVALRLWPNGLPDREPAALVEELYQEENRGKTEPSGSQDMIGLIFPGISRLDYDIGCRGGIFPKKIESTTDPAVVRWLERVIHMLPVMPRPVGYNPLGVKNLEPEWIRRLGQSGRTCYEAILARDVAALGASVNATMACWQALLPHTVRHPAITLDLPALLRHYQARHAGAMFSGCGGGYLIVISERNIPGSFRIRVRTV
jgi:hypothetical protein